MEQLDPTALENLRMAAGDELADMLEELIEVFNESAKESFDEIDSALTEEDRKRLNRAAHSLKGAALTFGSTTFAPAAFALERDSLEKEWPQLAIQAGQLKDLLPDFAAALMELKQAV
jgi:two-component system sensor histidine kinase/response regulator